MRSNHKITCSYKYKDSSKNERKRIRFLNKNLMFKFLMRINIEYCSLLNIFGKKLCWYIIKILSNKYRCYLEFFVLYYFAKLTAVLLFFLL